MVHPYHKHYIQQAGRWQKRNTGGPRLRAKLLLVGLLQLGGCDAVQIVENADTHVSVRYDGIMNGLDRRIGSILRADASRSRRSARPAASR